MVYCVQALLTFVTAATRDNRLAQAQTAIQNKPRFGDSTVTALELPANSVFIESRFTAKADEQTIEQQILGLVGLQAGSWVQVHDCPADQAPASCVVERRTVL